MATTPSSVTLSGFTGVDFNQILQSVLAAARIPIANLQQQVTTENVAISALGQLGGEFTSLQSALTAINSSLSIPPVSATASSGAPFSAQTTGGALPGSYQITVSQLAAAASVASQGYASSTASVGTGTITITTGGTPHTITIDSTNNTLAGVASAVNAAALGLTAQVFNTGLPGAPYRLEITSNSTGASQAFSVAASLSGGTAPNFTSAAIGPTNPDSISGTSTPTVAGTYTGSVTQGYHFSVTSGGTVGSSAITIAYTSDSGKSGTITVPSNYVAGTAINVADGLTLSLSAGTLATGDKFSVAAFAPVLSTAQDAKVQVGNQFVTSASNAVANAIPGVTLNLSSVGGPATVTVANDLNALGAQINSLVTAYNRLINDIQVNTQAVPNATPPPLAADGGLRGTLFDIQVALGTVNLSSLGVTVDQHTGQLTFKQSDFLQQEQSNPTTVTQALKTLYSALSPSVNGALTPSTGVIAAETSSFQTQITQNQQKIADLNAQLLQEQQQLQAEYAQLQALVSQYQSIAQLFGSGSSSSSGSGSPIPGSNLNLSA
jgi:flagellar hook-associated protein 2